MGLARFQHLRRRRLALSLTTRFCLPHEGMEKLEYLSRGSAFLLQDKADMTSLNELKVLTCQHVACPWLFPKYFAEKWDWLQFVSEEFVQHSLQLLEIPSTTSRSASVLVDIPLQQHVWIHPDRDVAMLQPLESDSAQHWESFLSKWNLATASLQSTGCAPGDHLLFVGHKQTVDDAEANEDAVGQFPMEVAGRFVGQSPMGQAFAWSEEILEEGMCGGAVMNEEGECVGLIEGIVPPYQPSDHEVSVLSSDASPLEERAAAEAAATKQMRKALENHVAFVPAAEINDFVQGNSQFMLTGLALDFD
ncbi:hypothetical protein PINS_up009921 [Pythium insidiosum]|nr:hypothetical protein PINS_up009921 [Pythium insidiosum]